MLRPCSVCERGTETGLLHCEHVYCADCFQRYVHGSVEELMHNLRCTICGKITVLTTENKSEVVEKRFGRQFPRLYNPTGFTQRADGSYAAVDLQAQKIHILSRSGDLLTSFPYVHNHEPMNGIAVTQADEIVIPCRYVARKVLAYFRSGGGFLGHAYLPDDADVQGLAVTAQNEVLVADVANACIHVIHPLKRLARSIPIPSVPGERKNPEPKGIALNPRGNIILTDAANQCVKVLSARGEMMYHFGTPGQRPGQFRDPRGVCVDSRGRILVADNGNKRIQLFDYEGNFLHFIVRYTGGEDVYMSPISVLPLPNNEAAVLLRGEQDVSAAEIRIYSCVNSN